MGKSARTREPRPCDECKQLEATLFRICTEEAPQWHFVCEQCLHIAQEAEGYLYGGTWKQKKRH